MGYLTHLKALFVDSIKSTFDILYPDPDFRDVHCSIEFPIDAMQYPGIWVDYEDVDDLQIAGVDHVEVILDGDDFREVTRWKFQGYMSFTVTALTSLERDRLYDELVSVIAFGRQDTVRGRFRQSVENNDFIAVNMQQDQIQARGNTASAGTPWGTDEIIYERTINVEVLGEFVPNDEDGGETLVPLSQIIVRFEALLPGETPEPLVNDPSDAVGPHAWH